MFANIFKGAPMGNKNAAGPHSGGGSEVPQADLDKIRGEHDNLKSKATKELLALHQSMNRVSGSYSAAEVGGKQGMIDDLLRKRHGQKRLDAFYNQPKVKKEDVMFGYVFKGAPYGNTNAAKDHKNQGSSGSSGSSSPSSGSGAQGPKAVLNAMQNHDETASLSSAGADKIVEAFHNSKDEASKSMESAHDALLKNGYKQKGKESITSGPDGKVNSRDYEHPDGHKAELQYGATSNKGEFFSYAVITEPPLVDNHGRSKKSEAEMVLGVKSQASVVLKANPEGINQYSKSGGKAHLDAAPGMHKASVTGGVLTAYSVNRLEGDVLKKAQKDVEDHLSSGGFTSDGKGNMSHEDGTSVRVGTTTGGISGKGAWVHVSGTPSKEARSAQDRKDARPMPKKYKNSVTSLG